LLLADWTGKYKIVFTIPPNQEPELARPFGIGPLTRCPHAGILSFILDFSSPNPLGLRRSGVPEVLWGIKGLFQGFFGGLFHSSSRCPGCVLGCYRMFRDNLECSWFYRHP